MFHDFVPAGFGGGEECRLAFVIAALHVSDEFGGVGVTVGDACIDVGTGRQKKVDRSDDLALEVRLLPATGSADGTTNATTAGTAHACGGHQRGNLEDVRHIHLSTMPQQGFD